MSLSLDIYKSSGFFQKRLKVEFPDSVEAFMPQEQLEIIVQVIANNHKLRKDQEQLGYILLLDVSGDLANQKCGYQLFIDNDKLSFKKFTNVNNNTVWNGTLKVH